MIPQFALLAQKRFAPYFGLQFLGALNDNLYKTALMVWITISLTHAPDDVNLLNNIGAAAFIFPFFIFSATAGQLADKFNKRFLIRIIKFAEVLIALLIAFGFYTQHFEFLLLVLFLLGVQAAFFSPVKYSVLPQYLVTNELMAGNGMVEMGTFVAILIGTILGGLFISFNSFGTVWVSGFCILFAFLGWFFSLAMPPAPFEAPDHELKINWEPISQTWRTLKLAGTSKTLLTTILCISWFWFFGSCMLTQIPNYTQLVLAGDAKIMTLLLISASLGIGLGSLACAPLAQYLSSRLLILLGTIGMSIFAFDLSFIQPAQVHTIRTLSHFHIFIDLFLIGFSGGLYSVPLYVTLQTQSQAKSRSQIIAANSILNALLMTLASGFALIVLKYTDIPHFFRILSILNVGIIIYVFASH